MWADHALAAGTRPVNGSTKSLSPCGKYDVLDLLLLCYCAGLIVCFNSLSILHTMPTPEDTKASSQQGPRSSLIDVFKEVFNWYPSEYPVAEKK